MPKIYVAFCQFVVKEHVNPLTHTSMRNNELEWPLPIYARSSRICTEPEFLVFLIES